MASPGVNPRQTLELVKAARKANNEAQNARGDFVAKAGNQQRTTADAIDALCHDNAAITTDLLELQGKVTSITAAKDRAEKKLADKIAEITTLRDAAHKNTLRSERDGEIIASLNLARTRAAEELKAKEERMEELKGALQELLNELKRQKAEASMQITQQSVRLAALEERLQNKEREVEVMVEENRRLEATLSEEQTESQAQRDDSTGDAQALRARLQELNEALARQRNKTTESEAEKLQAGKEIDRLQMEVAELRLFATSTTTEARRLRLLIEYCSRCRRPKIFAR